MNRRLPLSCVVLALVLAGCMGGQKADSQDPTPTVEELSNELTGFVRALDDSPVSEANVTLGETEEAQTTDDDGSYRFEDVPPGEYTLRVEKEGYLPALAHASIRNGFSTFLNVTLELAPPEARNATQAVNGHLSCHARVQQDEEAGVDHDCNEADPNAASVHDFAIEGGAVQLQVEAFWTPTTAAARNLTMRIETVDEGALNVVLATEVGPSGMKATIAAGDLDSYLASGGTVRVSFFSAASIGGPPAPLGAGAALQQTYEVAFTAFYGEPGPPDFSYRNA